FLYVKEKTKIKPILYGGGQQKGMRSGTENVPGVAGLGLAAELACKDIEGLQEYLFELKKYFAEGLAELPDVTVHLVDNKDGTPIDAKEREERLKKTAPHIMSVGFGGVRSEVLLHALEEKRIYVSSGSACSSNHPAVSGTLKAIDVKKELLDATVRFSFCRDTTKEELQYTLDVLKELLPQLRRFWRK
ncbi:MAG: aminotransferase class V-fold PLP-dependent enzyme, partial [Lachnospiraceae bacterium]|nr:aminotransferase class V-fold PLP-dependent enzyme [Lachnospiraceae bacterium]